MYSRFLCLGGDLCRCLNVCVCVFWHWFCSPLCTLHASFRYINRYFEEISKSFTLSRSLLLLPASFYGSFHAESVLFHYSPSHLFIFVERKSVQSNKIFAEIFKPNMLHRTFQAIYIMALYSSVSISTMIFLFHTFTYSCLCCWSVFLSGEGARQ